jgi:hypothetical protein
MLFTPLKGSLNNYRRVNMEIEDTDIPRGKVNKGKIFTVKERGTGKIYRAEVVACSLPNCYCDARLISNLEWTKRNTNPIN